MLQAFTGSKLQLAKGCIEFFKNCSFMSFLKNPIKSQCYMWLVQKPVTMTISRRYKLII